MNASNITSDNISNSDNNKSYSNEKESNYNHFNKESLFNYDSVVIYRATPYQKGRIAQLMVREGKNVLGIGDGNNDVGMLRESNVGVGILGKEGTQASLAGDFAIPQFRLLKCLLLVHGRYNLIRYSKIAINSYYKNLIFIGVQFFFNFFNAGSGKPIYNPFFMNYYNIIFTSAIPFSVALLDKDIPEHKATNSPEKYSEARRHFSRKIIFLHLFAGIIQAALLFFVILLFILPDFADSTGKLGGYGYTSTLFTSLLFFSVILRQIRVISFYNIFSYFAILFTITIFIATILWVHLIDPETVTNIYSIFKIPIFYFILAGACGIIYVSDTILDLFCQKLINPY